MIHILLKNELAWRIRVTFADGLPPRTYITPDIRRKKPGWRDEVFNRLIERIEFYVPTGHIIVLAGMEKYNFYAEAIQSPGLVKHIKTVAFYFCGKLPGRDLVEVWKVINPRLPDERGKIIKYRRAIGKEWEDGPTSGWKDGSPGKLISEIV